MPKDSSIQNKANLNHTIPQEALIGPILTIAMLLSFVVVLSQVPYATQVLAQPSIVNNTPIGLKNSFPVPLTLGNPFLEHSGKVTVQKIAGITNGLPKIETSYSANDTINGNITAKEIGTYVAAPRPNSGNNILYGEGQGVITTTKDREMATWTGQGIGHVTSDGKVIFRGSLFFSTTSTGKLAFLNNMVGIFQYEVDTLGNTSANVWGWK
jgi:hypothetical protein